MQLRSIHLSLRFILPLALVIGLFAYAIVPLVDNLTLRWFVRELDTRSQLLANALQDPLLDYVPQKAGKKINQLFDRAIQDERLFAVAFCDANGKVVYKTVTYPESLHCGNPQVVNGTRQSLVKTQQGSLHITESAVNSEFERLGKLMLVSDM
ncbi:MAG: trehalose-6-phosphate synthase, partial [Burkholderia sp.]|nr:trehalose-6-phosphate synthase [Burkholderia sp.]